MTTLHLPELAEALGRCTLALFIGADLPQEVTGLPSRADLARELARRKGLDGDLSLAEVAQRVGQAGNRWEFTDFIRNALDTIGMTPGPFHQRVAGLVKEHQIETLITTAYDNLLELAFRGVGIGLNRVVRGGDVNFISPDRPTLFKLYGDAQQPDTLVVTDRDHSELLRDRDKEALLAEVQRTFRRNTLLFLGYNLADPDFRFLFDQIAESRFARTAYAVWPGLSEVDEQMWRDRGIVILDTDPFGILDELSGAPQAPAPPTTSPPLSGEIDLDRGLGALQTFLGEADTETQAKLATLADRLTANRRDERLFGGSETTRRERAQIIFSLNELALKHCGVSFNELCQGVEPKPSIQPPTPAERATASEPPAPPSKRERAWIHFKLQIARLADRGFEVRALQTPMGEPHATGQLPYDIAELTSVLTALEFGHYQADKFTSNQTETLERLGLLRTSRLVPDLLTRIGGGLYQALFPEQVGTAFQLALTEARKGRATVALQLRFDQDAVALARYPWELLHDGHRHLLSGGMVELARYITYPEATVTLPVGPPWRLLFVAARPQDLAPLPDDTERLAVWNGLESLAETGRLTLDRLDSPTYDALLERLSTADFHIIHFDGHGVFARRCPECLTMNHPHRTTCRACATPLDDVPPQGYLAFEDEFGDADYVSTEAMENLLLGGEVRLFLLAACQSGVVQGESLFGGLGPGLIRAGVPAVVTMQFSVPAEAAIDFARGFYTALTQGETVPRAVAQGRRRLFRDKTWFIPTLYLRSTDDEGRLFVERSPRM
jgi:hypothetical protein